MASTKRKIPTFNPGLFPSAKSTSPGGVPLWELGIGTIEKWAKANQSIQPRKPRPPKAAGGDGDKTEAADAASASAAKEDRERYRKEQAEYASKLAKSQKLVANLVAALKSASSSSSGGDAAAAAAAAAAATADPSAADTYQILDDSFAKGEDVVHTPGAILTRLTLGGITNALAGVEGGIVDVTTCRLLPPKADGGNGGAESKDKKKAAADGGKGGADPTLPSAADLPRSQVLRLARKFHSSVQSKVELDMVATTPSRIVQMLCPELSYTEVNAIRRRVYDTVVLGYGTNSSAAMAALEGGDDVPVAARIGVHDIEKFHKCKVCGNNDQGEFVMDRKNGDLICTHCGTVATESLMHEGSAYRKFEGEEDRNHHGDAPNPLFSDAHNMSTALGGMTFTSGAGMGGYGSNRGTKGMENILRNAHAYTEMNISQFGKGEKKTRIGYKDRQKKDAFVQMNHMGDALNINESVIQRAKELFAGYRDDREMVQAYKGVLAACLCEAFDQLSRDGRQLLRQKAGEDAAANGGDDSDEEGKATTNARASRRNDLHGTSFAGCGGILIKTDKVKTDDVKDALANGRAASSSVEMKPASAWDLDDCRTWLLEASRSIARQWVEQAKNEEDTSVDIPKGTADELEGRLVECTLKLIDVLESELKGGANGKPNGKGPGLGRKPIATPRAANMGSLGIRWQHSHERGSGGSGGVGNSGKSHLGKRPRPGASSTGVGAVISGGRSAGQILILKTTKKLSAAIGDAIAGEAFHKELRALRERQEARKKQGLRDEAAQARFRQMQRKPWLQARAQL